MSTRNWPIGLSYDLLTGLDPQNASFEKLPWTLVLHNKDYPKEYLLKMTSMEMVWDHWLQQVKEACYMRDGNAKAIMNLSKEDTTTLLKSAENHRFEDFWEITDRLLALSNLNIKYVPIKVYLPMSNRPLQTLVKPTTESGDPNTVGGALNEHLPDLFPSKRRNIIARPILHGCVAPMTAPLGELLNEAMYIDGFLHITIVLMS